ncbi:hypothetical protein D1AOALGA4SA_9352 [Olavius algarvensis Delta 1 endosymbiont]|nr:hypothetical protein D1AOALGA4SA_9352 [Olavius algarvensis Delta 1 endosymbiont]
MHPAPCPLRSAPCPLHPALLLSPAFDLKQDHFLPINPQSEIRYLKSEIETIRNRDIPQSKIRNPQSRQSAI